MKRLVTYLARHAQAFLGCLGGLAHTPLASFMTVAVIGITLALPAAMWVAIDNALRLSSGWEGPGRISVFLKRDVGDASAQKLAGQIRRKLEVAKVEFISREQAFEEFKRNSGFAAALEALERNPLPAVLVVYPTTEASQSEALGRLAQDLRQLREVELAQLDLEWVKRLHAWLGLAQRGVTILAGLLAIAVLLIVGNTIRLAVLSRRDEIEVSKLVGATDAFIRRPFLYAGCIQGALGAILAWGLVHTSLWLLLGPIHELTRLYGNGFTTGGLDTPSAVALIAAGAGLGWIGARLTVGRYLQTIEPT